MATYCSCPEKGEASRKRRTRCIRTGNQETDKRLAGIFHAFTSVDGQTEQMNELNNMLFTKDHFPDPDWPIDPVPHFLLQWWLESYNAKYGVIAPARHEKSAPRNL